MSIRRSLLGLFFSVMFGVPICKGAVVADRVLFQIGNDIFNQSDLELYLATKRILFSDSNLSKLAITFGPETWKDQFREFQVDMVVLSDSVSLGRFIAVDSHVGSLLSNLKRRIEGNSSWVDFFHRVSPTKKIMLSTVSKVKTVFDYRRNKERLNRLNSDLSETNWISKLERQHIVRPFLGSQKYVFIDPSAIP